MKLCFLLFALSALCLLAFTVEPSLHLTITHTNFVDAVAQPRSGTWNPASNTIDVPADGGSGVFGVFCGETAVVTFRTHVGSTYECEASDDGLRSWSGSALKVAGTGAMVSLYDTPHPARSYRIKMTTP